MIPIGEGDPLMNMDREDVRLGELEAGSMEDVAKTEQSTFKQHNDSDVIIPDDISSYLVVSAHLLLLNCIVALVYSLYVLGALLLCVYLTSIIHWRKPRFSSIWRSIDYIFVAGTIGYGTYLSTTLSVAYMITWLVGLSVVGLIFATNETAYYLQIGKTPLGDEEESARGVLLPYAPPNTPEREWVFLRTAFVHLVCVHVLANALTLAIIVGSQAS
jgi:hypothetical protein